MIKLDQDIIKANILGMLEKNWGQNYNCKSVNKNYIRFYQLVDLLFDLA